VPITKLPLSSDDSYNKTDTPNIPASSQIQSILRDAP